MGLSTRYSDNSDGRLAEFGLEHPFYSLGTPRAGGIALLDDQRIDSRYDLGEVIDRYETQREARVYLLGLVGRPGGRLGAALSAGRDLRRARLRRRAR